MANPIPINESSITDRIGNSEVNRAKFDTKMAQSKSKSKNLVQT